MVYSVFLKDIQFFAYHGLYPEEAIKGNYFEVNLTVRYETDVVIRSIDDTVDYTRLYKILEQQMSVRRELLETLCVEICDSIKKIYANVVDIEITITKLNPPIENFKGSVGSSVKMNYQKD